MKIGKTVVNAIRLDRYLSKTCNIEIKNDFPGFRKNTGGLPEEPCTCIIFNRTTYKPLFGSNWNSSPDPYWDVVLYIFDDGDEWWNIIKGFGKSAESLLPYIHYILSDISSKISNTQKRTNICEVSS